MFCGNLTERQQQRIEFCSGFRIAKRSKEKGLVTPNRITLICLGRCDRIRTYDPLHPMQVRYQAAPHTEALNSSSRGEPDWPLLLLRIKQIGNRQKLISQLHRFGFNHRFSRGCCSRR